MHIQNNKGKKSYYMFSYFGSEENWSCSYVF